VAVDPLWRRAMQSLPVARLKVALARCGQRDDAWPPSLPEFLALAKVRPDEVGAPSYDAAWREATNRSPHSDWMPWSHKAVYWAAVRTGQTDLHERGHRMRAEFDREYERVLAEIEDLPEPPLGRIPQRTSAEREREIQEAAEEALPKLKAMTAGWA